MSDKHGKMRMDKVRAFLHAMGARGNLGYGTTKEQRRRFRKIKRIAMKRWCPYHKDDKFVFEAIYQAFNLHKYTLYGGYLWHDLRPLLIEPNPDDPWRPKRRRVSQEEYGSCRTWGLHGPVRKEYVPHCVWCGREDQISKKPWPDNEDIVEPFCDECHKKVRLMVEERKRWKEEISSS